MLDIKCINIVAMYKSATSTFFVLLSGGLGSVSPGFAACLFLRDDGHLATVSENACY